MTALTDLQVANLALGHLPISDPLTALTGTRTEVTWVNTYLALCKDDVLKAHHWSFAKKYLALTEVAPDTESEAWTYAYAFPTDCASIIKIWDGLRGDTPPEQRIAMEEGSELISTAATHVIWTDEPDATLVYTSSGFAADSQPLQYQAVIAALLASRIAMPLTKKPEFAQRCLAIYQLLLQQAVADDKNNQQADPAPESKFIRAR